LPVTVKPYERIMAMGRSLHSAAELIAAINSGVKEDKVSEPQRKIMLRDMSIILDKLNRPGLGHHSGLLVFSKEALLTIQNNYVTIHYSDMYGPEWVLTDEVTFNKRGDRHSFEDYPGYIRYHTKGEIELQYWFENGKRHRNGDEPAYVEYFADGKIYCEMWYAQGNMSRGGDKPAYIKYYYNGQVAKEAWKDEGAPHRDSGGPAVIEYRENGEVTSKEWFEYGEQIAFVKNDD